MSDLEKIRLLAASRSFDQNGPWVNHPQGPTLTSLRPCLDIFKDFMETLQVLWWTDWFFSYPHFTVLPVESYLLIESSPIFRGFDSHR